MSDPQRESHMVRESCELSVEPALEPPSESGAYSGDNGEKVHSVLWIAVKQGGTAEVFRSLWDWRAFFIA